MTFLKLFFAIFIIFFVFEREITGKKIFPFLVKKFFASFSTFSIFEVPSKPESHGTFLNQSESLATSWDIPEISSTIISNLYPFK